MPQDTFCKAKQALAEGKPIAILDGTGREGETDLYFPAHKIKGEDVTFLREHGRGELYFSLGYNVHKLFGMPYMSDVFDEVGKIQTPEGTKNLGLYQHMRKGMGDMVQGKCSVGPSFDYRGTKTGATDEEIAITMRKFAELYQQVVASSSTDLNEDKIKQNQMELGKQFHTPGHVFSVLERPTGLNERDGHTELSVAVARAAGIPEIMLGTVMVEKGLAGQINKKPDDMYQKIGTSALQPQEAKSTCEALDVPWLEGVEIKSHVGVARSRM